MSELDRKISDVRGRQAGDATVAQILDRYGSPAYRAVRPDPKIVALVTDFVARLPGNAGDDAHFWVQTPIGPTVHRVQPRPRGLAAASERRRLWREREHYRKADSRGAARVLTIGDTYLQNLYDFVCVEGRWSPAERLAPGGNPWVSAGRSRERADAIGRFMAEFLAA